MSVEPTKPGWTDWKALAFGGAQPWSFVGPQWSQDDAGLISPQPESTDRELAVWTAGAYADFEVEFEFRLDYIIAGAGFIFRAHDASHYYAVQFPFQGQQYRAKHFWAVISKVGDSGWGEVLRMDMVPGAPSEVGCWHRARLLVEGDCFRLWVDGRPLPAVHDAGYADPGYVGLESWIGTTPGPSCSFRNVRLRGKPDPAPPWSETIRPSRHWFCPMSDTTFGANQHCSGVTRAPNGDLLMMLNVTQKFHGTDSVSVMLRSRDNGRTWSPPRRIERTGCLRTTRDGRLLLMSIGSEPPFDISIASSPDNGQTWGQSEACGRVALTDDYDGNYSCAPLELRDGALVWFLFARRADSPPRSEFDAFCIRSSDGGRTWSEPVNLDGPNPRPEHPSHVRPIGLEISAAETRAGGLLALIRPWRDPTMWECRSQDGGRTWAPAARGTFPMYACVESMISTASGAVIVGGRFPALSVQASWDDGMTWRCWDIDTAFWANGVMYEVAPDLVLFLYGGTYHDPRVRVQLLRVTADGPEPAS